MNTNVLIIDILFFGLLIFFWIGLYKAFQKFHHTDIFKALALIVIGMTFFIFAIIISTLT